MKLDVTYNFQKETDPFDADRYSSTLQEYHRLLWSKALPSGKIFELTKTTQNRLYHKSDLGEFSLSSDRAVPTFTNWKKLSLIISQVAKEKLAHFDTIVETIGAITIWPSNRIGTQATINGAKGFNNKICDRLDLTLECIRRYYNGQKSPLFDTLDRYRDFFILFGDFKGYINFFYFQDAVTSDYESVLIAKPFSNFQTSPLPNSVDEYLEYMTSTINLIELRNKRITELEF